MTTVQTFRDAFVANANGQITAASVNLAEASARAEYQNAINSLQDEIEQVKLNRNVATRKATDELAMAQVRKANINPLYGAAAVLEYANSERNAKAVVEAASKNYDNKIADLSENLAILEAAFASFFPAVATTEVAE